MSFQKIFPQCHIYIYIYNADRKSKQLFHILEEVHCNRILWTKCIISRGIYGLNRDNVTLVLSSLPLIQSERRADFEGGSVGKAYTADIGDSIKPYRFTTNTLIPPFWQNCVKYLTGHIENCRKPKAFTIGSSQVTKMNKTDSLFGY